MDTLPPAFPSFPLPNSKFIALTASRSFRQCWQIFLELNSKRLCQSSGKENDSRGLTFTSSNKSEFKALSRRGRAVTAKKCTKKRDAREKLFFCNV